jgi:phage-related protein
VPFDAGTIIARLELDESGFDRTLDKATARQKAFEKDPVKLKSTEVFSTQDMSQARKRIADLDNQISRDATTRMRSSNGSVLGTLMALFSPRQVSGAPTAQQAASQGMLGRVLSVVTPGSGGGGNGRGGFFGNSGPGDKGFGAGLFNGIGPGVLGLGARGATILGLGGAALGALPALAGPLGALGIAGAGAGLIGLGAKGLIGTKQDPGQLYAGAQGAGKQLQGLLTSAAQPLVDPLKKVFADLPSLLKSVGPALKSAFAGAATLIQPIVNGLHDLAIMILPLLGKAFRAASPLLQPLIDGLGRLVAGVLPGLTALLKASAPAVAAFSGVLATLGKGVGQMLGDFAPAVKASAVVLKALGDVLGGLFPIIGQLAGVFAKTLAPIFNQLAQVIKSLEPVLAIVGHVLASLASAILGDLVAAFGALAKLLIAIEPSIKIFASALEQAFNVLENSGVFAVLGDTLEALVPILAKLINTLVGQLAPILPVLITLVGQFSSILIDLLAAGLETILTGVIDLVTRFKFLVPVLAALTAAWWLFNVALDANPIGLVIIAVVGLVGIITELVKHWSTVWQTIKDVASDAWNFIYNGFGKFLLPLLGPAGLIALGAIELAKHWHDITAAIASDADSLWQHLVGWGDDIKQLFTQTIPGWWDSFIGFTQRDLWDPVKRGFDDVTSYIHDNFVLPIENILTNTIPNAFHTSVRMIGNAWDDVENAVRTPVAWVVDHVINGLISAFDWISGKVGGPHISAVHPMGLATGGRIPGYGGGDRHLTLLEGGEAVISKETTAQNAETLRRWGVPGFARGGKVGQNPPTGNPHLPQGEANPNPGGNPLGGIISKIGDAGKILAAVFSGNSTALANAITSMIPGAAGHGVADLGQLLVDIPKTLIKDAVKTLIGLGGLGADAGAIVKYAESFIGRVPYVWGGTAVPGGADCSGFVEAIYRHFGIDAPRTSEQQGAWVRRGAPTPGGLAFYHSPAGGPDPGHVAIVRNASSVISQGGGMGPQVIPLHALPLLWTGVPPGGLGKGGGNLSGPAQQIARTLLARHGWGNQWSAFNSLETREAGWNLTARNPSSGAYGMAQFINGPSEYAQYGGNATTASGQLTAMMNYIAQRYGSANAAWAHELSAGWYDSGGWMKPGIQINGTGRREAVLNPSQSEAFMALAEATRLAGQGNGNSRIEQLLERVVAAVDRNATATGAAVGGALNGATRRAFYGSQYQTGGA